MLRKELKKFIFNNYKFIFVIELRKKGWYNVYGILKFKSNRKEDFMKIYRVLKIAVLRFDGDIVVESGPFQGDDDVIEE